MEVMAAAGQSAKDQPTVLPPELKSPTNVIQDIRKLNCLPADETVAFKVKGRLIWRTGTGCMRLAIGNATKSFCLSGDLSDLLASDFGDLVEVSGLDFPRSAMNVTSFRKLASWDGSELQCQAAFKDGQQNLWRYVHYTAMVREVLKTNSSCLLSVGNKVVVSTIDTMADKQLHSLLKSTVRVRGTSFRLSDAKTANGGKYLRIGVINPDTQIKVVEQRGLEFPLKGNSLSLKKQTIDCVTEKYIAVSGYRIATAMLDYLQPGDIVDIEGWHFDEDKHTARSRWIKKVGHRMPTPPLDLTGVDWVDDRLRYRPVRVQGTVEHSFTTETGLELTLSDAKRTYQIKMPLPEQRRQVDQYARGVVVDVCGVVNCILGDSNQDIRLDVGCANDLVIAETPIQLSSNLVKSVLACVAATVLLLVFWYWTLKRQVSRKTAELRSSASRMVAASSAVRDGLLIFDANSRVSFVSEKVNSTLGISIQTGESEVSINRSLSQLVCESDKFSSGWKHVFEDAASTFEDEFTFAESNKRVVVFSAPVYDDTGRPDGRIWTFEDTTQRRKLEEETLRSRKLGAIGRLAGGVAHDFNNLLQVIGSTLELMQCAQAQSQTDKSPAVLDTAAAAVERGAELTHQLLTFSKTSQVNFAPTDINKLLEESVSMMNRTLGDHIRLSVSLSNDLALANINAGQLEQVIINLCLNSSEAIGLNDGYIRIATQNVHHPQIGSSVQILVEDDGCGMTPEVLSHVFEPFFTTKDFDKGTGLGLATAFGAIEQMHGRIECASTVGKGTSFYIWLPALDGAHYLPATEVTSQGESSVPHRILLVDDDARVLETVNRLLVNLGHHVICASGGAEAIGRLESESVDVVMLDLSMPEMTGWQVLQQIRKDHQNLKVIVCSGYSDDAALMVESDVKPDAFLNKPFQLQQLNMTLNAIAS